MWEFRVRSSIVSSCIRKEGCGERAVFFFLSVCEYEYDCDYD